MTRSRTLLVATMVAVVSTALYLWIQRADTGRPVAAREAERTHEEGTVRRAGGPSLAPPEEAGAARLAALLEGEEASPPPRGRVKDPLGSEPNASGNLEELMAAITGEAELSSRLVALNELAAGAGEAVELTLAAIVNDPTLPLRMRRQALLLLSGKPGEVAFETLASLLYAEEVDLRLAAAQGLGILGSREAFGALSEAFYGESSAAVARAIVQSMSRIGTPELVDALIAYSGTDDLPTGLGRDEILGALAGVTNPRAVPALEAALTRAVVPEYRLALVSALAQIADAGTFDALLEVVRWDDDVDTRCLAMQGLGLIGDPRALPVLRSRESSADNARERSFARTAIGRLESS